MHYKKLGYTGLDVSTIGFGTWQIGGERWTVSTEKDTIHLLQHAHNQGINIFDVAVVYGQYQDENGYLQSRSQELLGKAFHNEREGVIYSVKVGQFDEHSHRHNYDPQRLVEQVQQSLRRLHTDYLDICLIHAPSIEMVRDGNAITVLKTLQALGIVKHIGYSFEAEPEHVQYALQQNIDVIMLQYNLIDIACKEVIEKARLHGVGILVGGPYKRGYLTGKYSSLDQLPLEDNYWKLNTKLVPSKVRETINTVNNLRDFYGSDDALRQNAIDFILNEAGVSSCIVGHRHLYEVDENIKFCKEYAIRIKDINESAAPEIMNANDINP